MSTVYSHYRLDLKPTKDPQLNRIIEQIKDRYPYPVEVDRPLSGVQVALAFTAWVITFFQACPYRKRISEVHLTSDCLRFTTSFPDERETEVITCLHDLPDFFPEVIRLLEEKQREGTRLLSTSMRYLGAPEHQGDSVGGLAIAVPPRKK